MRRIKIALVAALFVLPATLMYAQEPQNEPKQKPEESRPEKPETAPPPVHQNQVNSPRQEATPPRPQQEAKPPRSDQEMKPPQQERPEANKPPREESKPLHQQHGQQPQSGQQAQQGQHARPAGKSARIPEPKFKATFTRQHSFPVNRVVTQTTIVPNQTRFVYSGYTFIFLDPWPAEWMFTDECYIDFVDDEYFLFDVLHPGVRIALFVVE